MRGPGLGFGAGSLSIAPSLPLKCPGKFLESSLKNTAPVMGLESVLSSDLFRWAPSGPEPWLVVRVRFQEVAEAKTPALM